MVTWNPYNFSGIANASNATNPLVNLVQETSSQTSFLPGIYILSTTFIVLFLTLIGKGYGVKNVFAACSWVTMILAILLYPLHIIDGTIMIVFIMLMPISMFILFLGGSE